MITIRKLIDAFLHDKNVDAITFAKVKNIPIVPRKMVEMIIKKCEDYGDDCILIAEYAEALLKELEEYNE